MTGAAFLAGALALALGAGFAFAAGFDFAAAFFAGLAGFFLDVLAIRKSFQGVKKMRKNTGSGVKQKIY